MANKKSYIKSAVVHPVPTSTEIGVFLTRTYILAHARESQYWTSPIGIVPSFQYQFFFIIYKKENKKRKKERFGAGVERYEVMGW